ncbi:biopolymer transporter [cyanobiont of Ornithocercus magnificus]|nr:biopolymer transporter [cyanobiont of Ornithocercus magnificus]
MIHPQSLMLLVSVLLFLLTSCRGQIVSSSNNIDSLIHHSNTNQRSPAMGQQMLATIANRDNHDEIELFDLRTNRNIALPNLNQTDVQPISVSIDADAERVAIVRQREGRAELVIYLRSLGSLQQLELNPPGVPRHVSLDATGQFLAVEVSRAGVWQTDLLHLYF